MLNISIVYEVFFLEVQLGPSLNAHTNPNVNDEDVFTFSQRNIFVVNWRKKILSRK
jgi:hypothetical protein